MVTTTITIGIKPETDCVECWSACELKTKITNKKWV